MAPNQLQPRTVNEYARAFAGFAGLDPEARSAKVETWSRSRRIVVRAACRHAGRPDLADVVSASPSAPRKRLTLGMMESEAQAYEVAASTLPAGFRALALMPLATGLRSEELLSLDRAQVQRAVKTGELVFIRKGGEERRHPVANAIGLLQAMLDVPAAVGRNEVLNTSPLRRKRWTYVREILSPGAPITAYHMLRKMTVRLGTRPHLLRHAYATRLARDGAPLPVIQAALGHRSIETTMLYVSMESADIARFTRHFA